MVVWPDADWGRPGTPSRACSPNRAVRSVIVPAASRVECLTPNSVCATGSATCINGLVSASADTRPTPSKKIITTCFMIYRASRTYGNAYRRAGKVKRLLSNFDTKFQSLPQREGHTLQVRVVLDISHI